MGIAREGLYTCESRKINNHKLLCKNKKPAFSEIAVGIEIAACKNAAIGAIYPSLLNKSLYFFVGIF